MVWTENGKSLINPNQCRAFGISLCDDPTNSHRNLGIYEKEEDIFIPMEMNGSFCSILTRCLTLDELERCRKVCLLSEESWNPISNPFGLDTSHCSREYDGYVKVAGARSIDHHRHICAKEGTHALPTNQVPEGLSSFDTTMCSISPSLCHNTFVQRVVSSAKVDMPAPRKPTPITSLPILTTITIVKPTDAALTGQRHHPVTPASLAQKFGIGLSTATNTIQVTTQLGVRSALSLCQDDIKLTLCLLAIVV